MKQTKRKPGTRKPKDKLADSIDDTFLKFRTPYPIEKKQWVKEFAS